MADVNARILLWGTQGSGKTTTLKTIHGKLRSDLRGDLRQEPTRLDPTVTYEALPITLGETGGVGTQIELIAVPGAPDQAMTRKQLLDEVDGLVLVLDCSPERIESNFESIEELRTSLEDYGRSLDTFPVVLQYNKRDVADPFAIEDLHRRIGLDQSAVFETIATTGHGVLATLTTISKHVVRARRGSSLEIDVATAATDQNAPIPPFVPLTPWTPDSPVEDEGQALDELDAIALEDDDTLSPEFADDVSVELLEATPLIEDVEPLEPLLEAEPSTADILESAILAEGEEPDFKMLGAVEVDLGDDSMDVWDDAEAAKPDASLGGDLRIVSVGQASINADGGVRLPLVLGDETGESRSVVLSLRLDGLGDPRAGGTND